MKSLQKIEDAYRNAGFAGSRLRRALEEDKEYQNILRERKKAVTSTVSVTPVERKRYVLSADTDYTILELCKKLEQRNLPAADRKLVELAKTQLEHDWRTPLLAALQQLQKKYR